MSSAFLYALVGLILFIAGQWWGQRQFKAKAVLTIRAVSGAFEAYRECMRKVLTDKGEDVDALEKAALDIQIKKVATGIEEHLRTVAVTLTEREKEENKNGG